MDLVHQGEEAGGACVLHHGKGEGFQYWLGFFSVITDRPSPSNLDYGVHGRCVEGWLSGLPPLRTKTRGDGSILGEEHPRRRRQKELVAPILGGIRTRNMVGSTDEKVRD